MLVRRICLNVYANMTPLTLSVKSLSIERVLLLGIQQSHTCEQQQVLCAIFLSIHFSDNGVFEHKLHWQRVVIMNEGTDNHFTTTVFLNGYLSTYLVWKNCLYFLFFFAAKQQLYLKTIVLHAEFTHQQKHFLF